MIVDFIIGGIVIGAFVFGWRTGAIKAIFTLIGVVVAMLASVTVSAKLSIWLSNQGVQSEYLPLISFIGAIGLIFYGLKLAGFTLTKILSMVGLSLPNKIAGGAIMAFAAVFALSSMTIYFTESKWLSEEQVEASILLPKVAALAPYTFEATGRVIPFTKELVTDLNDYFNEIR